MWGGEVNPKMGTQTKKEKKQGNYDAWSVKLSCTVLNKMKPTYWTGFVYIEVCCSCHSTLSCCEINRWRALLSVQWRSKIEYRQTNSIVQLWWLRTGANSPFMFWNHHSQCLYYMLVLLLCSNLHPKDIRQSDWEGRWMTISSAGVNEKHHETM
jgi:hypothetical protein